jgi:molybdate/tungstate transport system ATP-binding protein
MIDIDRVHIRLPGFALQDINLTVDKGEFFSLIGPTGAGKTLILESIAGLIQPTEGRIRIAGRDVTRLPPEKRGVGIVYQDQALFPHLSVRENIRYGVRYQKTAGSDFPEVFDFLVGQLGLYHLLARPVPNLSGGEKQRVALARALAIDPAVLLLDEPLSSLDPNFREDIRQLLKDLHRQTGITVLMVTHDFSEAHFLARRVAVIHAGRIEQVGAVAEVFQRPATPFAADFVGMKNIFPAAFNGRQARIENGSLHITAASDGRRFVAMRPEHINIATARPEPLPLNCMAGVIGRVSNQGIYSDVSVDAGGVVLQSILPTGSVHAMQLEPGRQVYVSIEPDDIHVL